MFALNLMVLRSLLPPDLCPFADVAGGVSQFVDLVEDGDRDGDSDHPVLPDPLVLDVELHRELHDLGAERVGELHGTARGVRHREDWLSLLRQIEIDSSRVVLKVTRDSRM